MLKKSRLVRLHRLEENVSFQKSQKIWPLGFLKLPAQLQEEPVMKCSNVNRLLPGSECSIVNRLYTIQFRKQHCKQATQFRMQHCKQATQFRIQHCKQANQFWMQLCKYIRLYSSECSIVNWLHNSECSIVNIFKS